MKSNLSGILAPLLTPFDKNGNVNYEELGKLAKFITENGADGVFVSGTSGEFINLTLEERKRILSCVKSSISPDKSILFNITSMNIEEMKVLINYSTELEITNVSVIAPYYHKYDSEALLDYFITISELTKGKNLYLYNMEGLTGNPITPELLKKVVESTTNVKGIKDSSMDFMRILEYQYLIQDENFEILTGNDGQILSTLQAGGGGAVVVIASVYPELCKQILTLFQEGKIAQAREIQNTIIGLRSLCREVMPIASHKYLLELRGFKMGYSRFPLRNLSNEEKLKLKEYTQTLNINNIN